LDLRNFKLKVVTTTPLTELWTDEGLIDAKRGRQLTSTEIKEILTESVFVVADVGQRLNWIKQEEVFDFWKTDLQKRLWNKDGKIDLDKFPDGYAYLATEWVGNTDRKIILLEKFH
jgi:hypothetical protein